MFFKMLKRDLKQKKSFNVILLIFMIVASTLVVVSAIQVYAHLAGKSRSYEICNSSDAVIVTYSSVRKREQDVENAKKWLASREEVTAVSTSEMINFYSERIDFDNFDESLNMSFTETSHYITTQSFEQNLVYDLNDTCFYIENGCVGISQTIRDLTGVSIGDKVRLTTQMGYTYEFTVSHIFKDPNAMMYQRYLVSEADYAVLAAESPLRLDAYAVQLTEGTYPFDFITEYVKQENGTMVAMETSLYQDEDTYIIMYVLSVFMIALSIFMILIIFMTIRFAMSSAIKEEEKEIGMMKAIGVDSFQFRWLFAAKYIAFAIVGGIIGMCAGIPLARIMLNMFNKNTIMPDTGVLVLISVIAVTGIIALLLLFTMLAMRRIQKISVMDAIHGENRGERFKKLSGLYLHKRRHMPVPLYLAVSDLMNRFKRYLFLIIAYTLGITVILSTVHLRNSVMSEDFDGYNLRLKTDFDIQLSNEQAEVYLSKAGSDTGMLDLINEELKEAGIPARIEYDRLSFGEFPLTDGEALEVMMLYGQVDTGEFIYRKGGTAPQLANEIAVSYFTAREQGLQIGERITITYYELAEDRISRREVKQEFIITGFFDYLEQGTAMVIMGNEFENAYDSSYFIVKEEIDAPENQKAQYIEAMRKLYGAEAIKTTEEYLEYYMSDYDAILSLLEYVLSTIIILVLILITSLYSSVLLEEEIPTIAMLKSLGFENRSIKIWQLLRMGILLVISILAGNGLVNTVGQLVVGQLFGFLGLTGFTFVIEPVTTYILVPILISGVVLVTMLLRLRSVNSVEIWKIREE